MSKLTLTRVRICLGAVSIAAVRLAAGGSDENGVISFKGNQLVLGNATFDGYPSDGPQLRQASRHFQ
jgi:hypothetical protein